MVILKRIIRTLDGKAWTGSTLQVLGPGEDGDKLSGCIQWEELAEYMRNDRLFKKDSAPYSQQLVNRCTHVKNTSGRSAVVSRAYEYIALFYPGGCGRNFNLKLVPEVNKH